MQPMIHPDMQLTWIGDSVGYGIVATAFIPRGTLTFAQDDLDIRLPADHPLVSDPRYAEQVEKYSFCLGDGTRVISWDHAKYVNHCCHFNTIATAYGCEIAVRDIQPGEEVTAEYAIYNLDEPMELSCPRGNCRGLAHPDDFERMAGSWDALLREVIPLAAHVPQPLLGVLRAEYRAALLGFLSGQDPYRPVATLRYPRRAARGGE